MERTGTDVPGYRRVQSADYTSTDERSRSLSENPIRMFITIIDDGQYKVQQNAYGVLCGRFGCRSTHVPLDRRKNYGAEGLWHALMDSKSDRQDKTAPEKGDLDCPSWDSPYWILLEWIIQRQMYCFSWPHQQPAVLCKQKITEAWK